MAKKRKKVWGLWITTKDGKVVCNGPWEDCSGSFFVDGLKPLDEKVLEAELSKLEALGRMKLCVGCNTKVIACENCCKASKEEGDSIVSYICSCCLRGDADGDLWDDSVYFADYPADL